MFTAMEWLVDLVFCALVLRSAADNVETRIHQLIRPQASAGIQFGASLESDNARQNLFIGAPKKQNGGTYKCSYVFNSDETPVPIQCSDSFTYGTTNSSTGSSMARIKSDVRDRDFLVVCGNQYTFFCPNHDIQQRMIGKCYSHNLKDDSHVAVMNPCTTECPQGLVADLVFLLDASGSVGSQNFQIGLVWINTVLSTFRNDIDNGNVQVGYVVFSTSSYDSKAPTLLSYSDVTAMISKIEYYGGQTYTSTAIDDGVSMLTSSRIGVTKVMITVTDGESNIPSLTVTASRNARSASIVMIAVGVGSAVARELRQIATGDVNDPTRVMTVSSYDNLDSILDELSNTIKETASTGLEGAESNSTTELTNCQFGTSVAASENGLYIGAMGSYDRTGTVAEFNDLNGFPNVASNGLLNDTELAALLSIDVNELKEAYFGYSVATGKFKTDQNPWIAMGAPRYMSRGAVLLHEARSTDTHILLHPATGSAHWQLGGGYGHTLLAMDINNDNYDDLLIAAPLFSQTAGYDEGIVFVYMNDKLSTSVANWKRLGFTPLLLEGSRAKGSRFGMAIANGGDIDGNGFDDVIIGAPGEKESETDLASGAIYVYFSSAQGLNPKKFQRIEGKSVVGGTAKLSGFGRAILGGADFDRNGYPDMAVSAPYSDSVVLLRSRKLILVTAKISAEPIVVDIVTCAKNPSAPCSSVRVCISAQYQKNPNSENFEIIQNITLDSLNRESLYKRFYFAESNSDFLSITQKDVRTLEQCQKHAIQLNINAIGKTNGGEIDVTPRVEISTDLSPSHKLKSMSGVLSPLSQNLQTADLSFATGCSGVKGRCEHDLVLTATYSLPITSSPVILTGAGQIFAVMCTMENKGPDHAYFLKMNISSGDLRFNRVISTCMLPSDEESDFSAGIVVLGYNSGAEGLKDLMPSGAKCEFSIEFDFSKMELLARESRFRVTGKVYSNAGGDAVAFDLNTGNNEFTYSRPVQYKSNIILSATSEPESVFFYPPKNQSVKTARTLDDDILGGNTTIFIHEYSLYNGGPLGMANAKVSIKWPEFTVHGNELLYFIDVWCRPATACNCHKTVKTNKFQLSPNKMSVGSAFKQVNISYPERSQTVVLTDKLTCQNAGCNELLCDISHMKTYSQVTIFASFKPWIPTFGQEFTKAEISTVFKLIPLSTAFVQGNLEITVGSTMMSYDPSNPPPAPPTSNINIGVIIGAILGGLAFLAIVIVALWKAGFFNSKYEQMTREAQAAQQEGADGDGEMLSSSANLYDN